jgi:hypothetical protein
MDETLVAYDRIRREADLLIPSTIPASSTATPTAASRNIRPSRDDRGRMARERRVKELSPIRQSPAKPQKPDAAVVVQDEIGE